MLHLNCHGELSWLLGILGAIPGLIAWYKAWRHHRKYHGDCDQ